MGINVTDYRYLFESLNDKSSGVDSFGRFELNNIGSKGIQSQLRAAGIDTNSKAYQHLLFFGRGICRSERFTNT